jgi:carbamoyltransferase
MYILGLSAMGHHSAAALLGDSGILAAIEESKLTRNRVASGIPREAIRFCLHRAGIEWNQIAHIAIASNPRSAWKRQTLFRARRAAVAPVENGYFLNKALGELGRELNNERLVKQMSVGGSGSSAAQVESFDHHLCHAASAFYASPFDQALIVTLDELGDGRSGFVGLGNGPEIRELVSLAFPNSLAYVYSQVTRLVGYQPRSDEHKTQWLSLEGTPTYKDAFLDILHREPSGPPHIDPKFFTRTFGAELSFTPQFYRRMQLPVPNAKSPASAAPPLSHEQRANIAASLQSAMEDVVCDWLAALRAQHNAKSVCLAGGLFLNPLLVAAVESRAGFERVFAQPAAGNEGAALGAAWLALHRHTKLPRSAAEMSAPFWGPAFSNQEIKEVLDNCKATYHFCDTDAHKIDTAAHLLRSGKIVGWFQGAAEFGPRALGHRSLLASPWAEYVTENLNDYVKHREAFRPFALSITAEDAPRYFHASPNARFLTTMATATDEGRALLGALPRGFLLPGNLVRLHVVREADNPTYYKLLKHVGDGAPAPMLVNASFNLFGEPLVITPRDAVRSYFCSGVDALLAGSFLLQKK